MRPWPSGPPAAHTCGGGRVSRWPRTLHRGQDAGRAARSALGGVRDDAERAKRPVTRAARYTFGGGTRCSSNSVAPPRVALEAWRSVRRWLRWSCPAHARANRTRTRTHSAHLDAVPLDAERVRAILDHLQVELVGDLVDRLRGARHTTASVGQWRHEVGVGVASLCTRRASVRDGICKWRATPDRPP